MSRKSRSVSEEVVLKSNSEEWIVHQVGEEGEGREGKGKEDREGGKKDSLTCSHGRELWLPVLHA